MQLVLTQEQEVAQFLDYLYKQNKLTSYFTSLTLDDDTTEDYLLYISNNPLDDANEGITVNINKRWTTGEREAAYELIKQMTHPLDIADQLDRTESGVRNFARNKFNLIYNTKEGRWKDQNFK